MNCCDLLPTVPEGVVFAPKMFETLPFRPALISELPMESLNQHFPQTFYADLLDAVGLEIQFEQTLRRRRDPAFCERVLMATRVAGPFVAVPCGWAQFRLLWKPLTSNGIKLAAQKLKCWRVSTQLQFCRHHSPSPSSSKQLAEIVTGRKLV